MQWDFKSWVVVRILECNYKKEKIYLEKKWQMCLLREFIVYFSGYF